MSMPDPGRHPRVKVSVARLGQAPRCGAVHCCQHRQRRVRAGTSGQEPRKGSINLSREASGVAASVGDTAPGTRQPRLVAESSGRWCDRDAYVVVVLWPAPDQQVGAGVDLAAGQGLADHPRELIWVGAVGERGCYAGAEG
jgi:hypothetical protein